MKLRNYILAMAVAGVNVYLANDIRVQRNELSLLNLENIADACEDDPIEVGPNTTGNLYISSQITYRGEIGYSTTGTKRHMDVTYTYWDCDGKTNSPCTPYTDIHYSYGS